MNDYEQIRKRYLAGESQRHIAESMGISRNTVKKYCEGAAVPWERKTPERKSTVVTDEVIAFIRACLEEDQAEGLRKQRHTAKRIYDRLVDEMGFTGGESTIRRVVREVKAAMPKAFVPLQFDPGDAMQIDWGEAAVYLNGEKTKVYLFCARLCFSCRPVVLAYRRQNEESFLDACVKIFQIIGGVPKRVIFDNGKVAVKSGHGRKAILQDGYDALRAHYGFEAVFCNPAEGHEKGLVEGLVGWARRNICVPVPRIESIRELNDELLKRCLDYETHTVRGRSDTVGNLYVEDRMNLLLLPKRVFETARCMSARVNASSTVRFMGNAYSVPVKYAGHTVSIKGYPETVEIYSEGLLISRHERLFVKNRTSYHLEDYMPLLEKRPRAVFDAAPVKQNLPPDVLRQLEEERGSHEKVIQILQFYIGREKNENTIKDPVEVPAVDLHLYDALCIGKEGQA